MCSRCSDVERLRSWPVDFADATLHNYNDDLVFDTLHDTGMSRDGTVIKRRVRDRHSPHRAASEIKHSIAQRSAS